MNEYVARQQRLQQKMRQHSIDACIVSQNVDLYYFTGSMQTGYLMIPSDGGSVYYVKRSVVRAQEESAVKVKPLGSIRAFGKQLADDFPALFAQDRGQRPTVAAEFDVLPVQIYQRLNDVIPGVRWTDGSAYIRETRMIKSPYEVSKIKEAAAVVDIAFEQALSQLRVGMTELELMSIIENTLRLQGHLGIMRMRGYNQEIITGMVGSGYAAARPTYFDGPAGGQGLSAAGPQSSSRKAIERNEPVLIDIGCCIDGYVIDQTRTVVIGALSDDLLRAYHTSEEILRQTEAVMKPGTSCEELYFQALEQSRKAGLGDHFMGYGEDQVKFLGHGIGLEIDELPVLAKGFTLPLLPGMVIAVEPKFTFPGKGVVGIENSYLITDSGFETLTRSREGLIQL